MLAHGNLLISNTFLSHKLGNSILGLWHLQTIPLENRRISAAFDALLMGRRVAETVEGSPFGEKWPFVSGGGFSHQTIDVNVANEGRP